MQSLLNKPRILILSSMYPSSTDRIMGIFIHQYVKNLKKLGINFRLISPVPWSPKVLWFREKWKYYGCIPNEETIEEVFVNRPRYVELPFKNFRSLSGLSMFLCLFSKINHLYKTFKFNIIHAHTITPDGHAAMFFKRHFNVPMICTVRGSDLNEYPFSTKKMYKTSKKVLEEADAIITVSKDLANRVKSIANIKRSPYIIYNGIDTSKFYNYGKRESLKRWLGISPKWKVISFIGRCEKEKGIFELFEAFIRIDKSNRNVCLLIIGDGKDKFVLHKLINQYNLNTKVLMKENVLHEEIPKYLNASDIFVLPSYSEGLPNVLLEAIACELPVVATKVGGIPEIIFNEQNGLLCTPGDSTSIENSILEILSDLDNYRDIGKKASEKIKVKFSWNKSANETLYIYKEVLSENESRRLYKPAN